MTTMHLIADSQAADSINKESPPVQHIETVEDRRARRMKALKAAAGLWAGRKDIPADGLEYQRALRAEWP
jgi:hypothetical protein